MKGMTCPPQINPSFEFSVLDYDQAKFDTMPAFIQEMVRGSKEYQAMLSKPVGRPVATDNRSTPVANATEETIGQVVSNSIEDSFDDLPF